MKYFVKVPLLCASEGATCFAKSTKYIEEGAERVTFEFREATGTKADGKHYIVGPPLVWKENVQFAGEQLHWHVVFAATQLCAARLAKNFNRDLDKMCISENVPRVQFIDPMFYHGCSGNQQWVNGLCEEFLPGFTKWTDNRGGIKHVAAVPGRAGVEEEFLEEEHEEENSGDDDNEFGPVDAAARAVAVVMQQERDERAASSSSRPLRFTFAPAAAGILDVDVLLAFSHWTYVSTRRKNLVCDLQGTLTTTEAGKPLYKLTDPSIHSNKKKAYGKTDHGRTGVTNFFKSHECNALCQALGLGRGAH